MSLYAIVDALSGIGREIIVPSGKIGLGILPADESNPFLLRMSFIGFHRMYFSRICRVPAISWVDLEFQAFASACFPSSGLHPSALGFEVTPVAPSDDETG